MTDARAGHLDLDALADVLAGERTDDAHLRSCGSCADRLAELAAAEDGVVAALAALAAPPVPDGLVERLTAALRDEGDRAAAEQERRAPAPVVPLRRRLPAWLPAVAASLVLVLAGVVGFAVLDGPGPGADSATTAAGGGSAERSIDGDASRDAEDSSAADSAPEAESGPADSGPAAADLAAPAPVRSSTGTDWAVPAERAAAVPQVLAGAVAAPLARTAPAPAGPDPLERLREPSALAACLSALPSTTTPGTQTLAVDYAVHAGAPALAVVQRDADPAGLLVSVVGPGCGPGEPGLLLRTRVPPP